eukprot:UN24365
MSCVVIKISTHLFSSIIGFICSIVFRDDKTIHVEKKEYAELFVLGLHFYTFNWLMPTEFTFLESCLVYSYIAVWQGIYLGFAFALNHFPLPVIFEKPEQYDWVTLQCITAVDY